jgi:hypothetical protein
MFRNWHCRIDPARRKRLGAWIATIGLLTWVGLLGLGVLLGTAATSWTSLLIVLGAVLVAVGTTIRRTSGGNSTYGVAVLFADHLPREHLVQQLRAAGVHLEETRTTIAGWLPTPETLVSVIDTTWELDLGIYDPAHHAVQHRAGIARKQDDLRRILGGEPHTMLTLALEQGHVTAAGELAAMRLICHLAHTWPCAVETGDEQIRSAQDIGTALHRQQPILAMRDVDTWLGW